jgi:AmmeMemoRadiSam system protein A
MHEIVKLAKDSVEHYVLRGEMFSPPPDVPSEMKGKAGVFVCIKKAGELRGCIGTYTPATENVAREVIQNAIGAATQDPRFSPVDSSELDELEYSVDVLSLPERVDTPADLSPKRFGILVKKGNRKGLLLPDLEGVDTVDEQIRIASVKAGISPEEEKELYRFEVKRYT